MRIATLVLSIALLQGCATNRPMTGAQLMSTQDESYSRHTFTVPVPVKTAYRNALAKARECWQTSTSIIPGLMSMAFVLETDPFDPDVGYARIAVVIPGQVALAAATFKPQGNGTAIEARAKVSPIGTHLGETDVPLMDKWATGEPVECQLKFLM